MSKIVVSGLIAVLAFMSTQAMAETPWTVKPEWVAAHEAFLASDALNGRGSATRDEAIAATYVASQFQGYGVATAPGMNGYLQPATIVRLRLNGAPSAAIDGKAVDASAMTVLISNAQPAGGTLAIATDAKALPAADVIEVADVGPSIGVWQRAATAKGVKLVILRESDATRQAWDQLGHRTRLPVYLEEQGPSLRPSATVISLSPAVFDTLKDGAQVTLTLPGVTQDTSITNNAIGFIQGSDPKAGTVLYTAHLDHFPPRPDGAIMHGANDDASGTTAVLEIAHALAAGAKPRRSILFVCYGSEEIGAYGSQYFAIHPPVALNTIIANIEFEMIGAQDPKLPADTLMMTGYERSDLGEALQAHGALVAADPYPDMRFFQRSDNYSLALTGVVAHTLSGWAVTPTYHTPDDTLGHLNLPFMTKAIQSLIEPARWLANSDFTPQWKPGGKPVRP